MTTPGLVEAALAAHDAGLCVIPVRADGSKAPAVAWKTYTQQRPERGQVEAWARTHDGIGVVCGAVSGGVEMLELEGRAVDTGGLAELTALASAAGLGELWTRVLQGYVERTPSGGVHLLYRLDGGTVPGNLKLARDERHQVLAETRGEGGFVVVAPSAGTVHDTGKPWTLAAGGPATIATVTGEEREQLLDLARTLDRAPDPDPVAVPSTPVRTPGGGVSPGDDFEARTSWAEILEPYDWRAVHSAGRTVYWRRPGKDSGISATTGRDPERDRLYVFTTSTEFDAERPYTKFGAHALLEHGGDHSAAAKALRGAGYGKPAPEPPRPAPADRGEEKRPADMPAPAAKVTEPRTYTLTDDGNALRLVDGHADEIRYCPERGRWLSWDGHRWRWDHAGYVAELARHIARALPQTDDAQRRHRRISLSSRGLAAATHVARTDPRIVAHLGALDARPFELNTPAGAIDLRTGKTLSTDPAALHTRSTTTAPDTEAPTPLWTRFLAQTFAGDEQLAAYVQRLIGVSLVGRVLEQLLPFPYGAGRNGKSTLLGVITRLLGIGEDGYALSAPSELLLATAHSDHPTEIARLAGARMVVTSELEEGQKFAEAKVKLLTGGDPIAARFMRGDYFDFLPTHTIWMVANHQPQVRSGGPAFWRRLRLLPFLHVVPPEEAEAGLEARLVEEEGPGILAWAITGARDYFAHGLTEPESVRVATEAYEADQDSIGRFVDEECETGSYALPHMNANASELRTAYEAWCHAEGETATSVKAFSLALQRRWNVVVDRPRGRGRRFYRGIKLNDPVRGEDDPVRDDKIGGPGW